MEEWVECMVVVRRIVEVLHIAEEVVLRIQELGIHIVAVGEVGHNLAVAEDMLVDHIGPPAELENRMGAAEEDMLVDRTALGVAHHTLAVEGDILEEGIDLEAVDHKPVDQEEVGHMVVEGEDTVHRAVGGNLFTISACHHLNLAYEVLTTLRRGSAIRRISALISHVCSCCINSIPSANMRVIKEGRS
jgi:hypothetical protein